MHVVGVESELRVLRPCPRVPNLRHLPPPIRHLSAIVPSVSIKACAEDRPFSAPTHAPAVAIAHPCPARRRTEAGEEVGRRCGAWPPVARLANEALLACAAARTALAVATAPIRAVRPPLLACDPGPSAGAEARTVGARHGRPQAFAMPTTVVHASRLLAGGALPPARTDAVHAVSSVARPSREALLTDTVSDIRLARLHDARSVA